MAIVASASTFTGNSPEFSLRADTSGGPPVEYFWTRNGEPISDDDTFDIALDVTSTTFGSQPRANTLRNARYNNTLVVRATYLDFTNTLLVTEPHPPWLRVAST